MSNLSPRMKAGQKLRALIAESERCKSQEDFAEQYGADVRTISRYINNGIKDVDLIQDLADWFGVEFADFFQ